MIQARYSLKFLFLGTFFVAAYLFVRGIAIQFELGLLFAFCIPQGFAIGSAVCICFMQTRADSWERAKLGFLFGGITAMFVAVALGVEITVELSDYWNWQTDWPTFAIFLFLETVAGAILGGVDAGLRNWKSDEG